VPLPVRAECGFDESDKNTVCGSDIWREVSSIVILAARGFDFDRRFVEITHMRLGCVYFSASPDAIDASIYTKDLAVTECAGGHGVSLSRIGAIGDGANDIPFLRVPGLALAAAPNNAQEGVKRLVASLANGTVLKSELTDGFLEFYELAKLKGLSHVFADRDGVIEWETDGAHKEHLFGVFQRMGIGQNPFVFVLTGSSYEQNLQFIEKLRIPEAARQNPAVREQPFIVLAENGAVQINVLTLDIKSFEQVLDADLLRALKTSFEGEVRRRLKDAVLPRFGLTLTEQHGDQVEKVYVPPKRTMVTVNVPKFFRDGSDYRSSPVAQEFRGAVLELMQGVAHAQDLPHELLS